MRYGDDWDVYADLNLASLTKVNILIVGPEHLVVRLVRFLDIGSTADRIRRQGGQLVLPPASSQAGTVVVRNVDALTPEEQRQLLSWLDSNAGCKQLVSTASAPLLPLVETGAFNDTLYYRSNMMYVDLSE